LRESAGAGFTSELGNFSAIVGRSDVFNGVSESKYGTERDEYEMNHASGKWSKNFDKGKLDASLYFVKSKQDIDEPGLLPDKKSFGWVDDTQGKLSDETWVAQLHGQYDLSSNWNTSLQLGFTQDGKKMKTTAIKPFSITNQLFMADWKNTHPLALSKNVNASIVWGVNAQHQQTLNIPSSQTIISPNVHGELVLDKWKFDADTRFDQNDTYGNHQVFSIGVNRSLSQTTNVWAKGGTGYRQPGVSELMHPIYGNKTLQGESSRGGEMGVRWNPFFESEISISGYYQNYQQMILFLFDPTIGTVRAGNLPEANVFGVEFQSQHRWSDFWKSGLNYGYMSAKNAENHLYVPNLPEHQGVFWNELQLLQHLKMRVDLTFHDAYFFNGSNTKRADAAPRVNALLKYQLTPKTDVYLRGENIANNRTIEINDFSVNGAAVYFGLQTGF
jgi:outer membrane cobalamin receptor